MTKNRTSMADIAVHAGVSTATVSRVFNGVGQVSDETRRKVLTAIDELGYDRPTPERTPDTPTIGVIVPELTNPIFAAFAHHLQEEVAAGWGYRDDSFSNAGRHLRVRSPLLALGASRQRLDLRLGQARGSAGGPGPLSRGRGSFDPRS